MQAQLVNGWWECEREVKGQKSKVKRKKSADTVERKFSKCKGNSELKKL